MQCVHASGIETPQEMIFSYQHLSVEYKTCTREEALGLKQGALGPPPVPPQADNWPRNGPGKGGLLSQRPQQLCRDVSSSGRAHRAPVMKTIH